MGEFWSLTHDERVRVMDIVAEEAAGRWPVGAHVTHTSSRETVDLAKHAEAAGFDLLVVAAPYMEAKTEDQVIDYVRTLSDNTNLAVMFYNSPQFGIVMSPHGLRRICELPQVVGVKEASFNQQLSIETHLSLGKDYVISTPDEWIYPFAQDLGFHQQVMFANTSDWRFDTAECNYYVQFIEKASVGDYDDAFYEKHLRRLKELSDTWWTRTMDKNGGALPVAMVKYWGELMGMAGGPTRQPLPQLTSAEKAQLKEELMPLKPKPPVSSVSAQPRAAWLTGNNNFATGMLLMVSVQDVEEALEAERGGADVVDVKNLQEALVGSGHPTTVRQVRAMIQPENHVSVTLGVVPNQAGTVAMAAYAAAVMDATSVKIGFMVTDYDVAVEVLRESRRAMEGYNTKLVGSLFADNLLYEGGLDPHLMVQLAKDGECDGFLIDTLIKDGRNLFDFLTEAELRDIVLEGKKLGLSTALSGHPEDGRLGRARPRQPRTSLACVARCAPAAIAAAPSRGSPWPSSSDRLTCASPAPSMCALTSTSRAATATLRSSAAVAAGWSSTAAARAAPASSPPSPSRRRRTTTRWWRPSSATPSTSST